MEPEWFKREVLDPGEVNKKGETGVEQKIHVQLPALFNIYF